MSSTSGRQRASTRQYSAEEQALNQISKEVSLKMTTLELLYLMIILHLTHLHRVIDSGKLREAYYIVFKLIDSHLTH